MINVAEIIKEQRNIKIEENNYSLDFRPRLEYKSSYRNLYLAVISNAFNQLLEPLSIQTKIITKDIASLASLSRPESINLKWEFKVANNMDYNMAFSWFLSSDKNNIFDFLNCCDAIGLSPEKLISRAKFIAIVRENIIADVSKDTEELKNILRRSCNIYSSLKRKYLSKSYKKQYSLINTSRKSISYKISEEYEKEFGVNPVKLNMTMLECKNRIF